jgi:ribonuclease III
MKIFLNFLSSLGLFVKDTDTFRLAFTHRSFVNENGGNDNERLEFLGDAVLELVTTEYLFREFPEKPEGHLTAIRSALVQKNSLAKSAEDISLGNCLFLSKGEEMAGGRKKPYILANTFEAVIGALFLELGISGVRVFLDKTLFPSLETILKDQSHIGPKTEFQEMAQEKFLITPHYKLLFEEGPDHAKVFTMGAFLDEKKIGEGKGTSKQNAEMDAAKNALENLKTEEE